MLDRFFEALESGEVPLWRYLQTYYYWETDNRPSWVSRALAYAGISTRAQRAALLETCNELVEAAKLPPEKQEDVIVELTARAARLSLVSRAFVLSSGGELMAAGVGRTLRSATAQTRCVITMLAVERYRRMSGHWPSSLEALVPAQLKQVPLDPYDGKPLRYRLRADGAVIYSVGPDLKDDDGKFERNGRLGRTWGAKPSELQGLDIGVRLWDLAHRRQPPKGATIVPPR